MAFGILVPGVQNNSNITILAVNAKSFTAFAFDRLNCYQ
jgi:hypothetical protein